MAKASAAQAVQSPRNVRRGNRGSLEARLPTLAECETAIGEKAETWVARCYEISSKIVTAGLVKGEAVYGHWLGGVHPESHFGPRRSLPFIPHGWIQLEDGRVLDPTRWVFEHVSPYLYVGEKPDSWNIIPCDNCGLLREEHRDGGPEDRCEMYEQAQWPYDEGGNRWREAQTCDRPIPGAHGPNKKNALDGYTAAWVASILKVEDATHLTAPQLLYLANMSYDVVKRAVGPEGVKALYEAICDFNENSIVWLPLDNFNRAKRECGLERDY